MTYDPTLDDDLLALALDDQTAAAEHAELSTQPYDPTVHIDLPLRPFAVYGTLRPGHPADDLWAGLASLLSPHPYFVPDYRLTTNGGFPYAVPSPGHAIVVDLIVPRDEAAARLLTARLDRYEGAPSHYERVPVFAFDPDSPQAFRANLYVPTDPERAGRLPSIPSGDWNLYRQERA